MFSCDIRDVRCEKYKDIFSDVSTFVPGTSKELSAYLRENNIKIDTFYIDGSHEKGAVIKDVMNLKKSQSENPIWIFDDFDIRFGCYEDIKLLCNISKKYKVYSVGNTMSGNPTHQAVTYGKF